MNKAGDPSKEYIIHATHECVIHEKVGHRLFTKGRIWPYLDLLEEIRNRFRLAPLALLELTYLDWNSDSVGIVNNEELRDAILRQKKNPLVVKVVQKCSPPYVRVLYGQTQQFVTFPQGEPCYAKLHSRVRNIFQLPKSVEFEFSYEEPGSCEPQMTVANDEVLLYVLEKESPNCLRLHINVVGKANANDVCDSNGERSATTCSDVVTISNSGTVRALALTPVELESSCEQFLGRIRDVFILGSSTQLELSYTGDSVGDSNSAIAVALSRPEKLKDALSRQARPWSLFASVVQKTSFVVKISHNGTLRRLTLHSDESHFSYEKLQSSIRDLFKLSISTSFVLNYIDEDQDSITIMDDEDLRDALVLQPLDPLKVTIVIAEGENDINQNPEIAQPSGL